jgi:hypothetical protein
LEPLLAELLNQVRQLPEIAHFSSPVPFLERAHSLPTWQRGSAGFPAFF